MPRWGGGGTAPPSLNASEKVAVIDPDTILRPPTVCATLNVAVELANGEVYRLKLELRLTLTVVLLVTLTVLLVALAVRHVARRLTHPGKDGHMEMTTDALPQRRRASRTYPQKANQTGTEAHGGERSVWSNLEERERSHSVADDRLTSLDVRPKSVNRTDSWGSHNGDVTQIQSTNSQHEDEGGDSSSKSRANRLNGSPSGAPSGFSISSIS